MTREEIYNQCVQKISNTNCLLLEAATGTGKSKISIDLINHLINSKWYTKAKTINILLLVAKRVHKQTWNEEISKWGGINHPSAEINICMECYESLKNHCKERWDIILADEVHHIGSEIRQELLQTMSFGYFIGLSATIPRKVKAFFRYHYHAQVVTCNILEAIEDDILPDPEILLFPLKLDNTVASEQWEMNPKAAGPVQYADYAEKWKFKNKRVHTILRCTQKQKSIEFNAECLRLKNRFNMTRNEGIKNLWLQMCGKRLEYYSDCKLPVVKKILQHLNKYRTITFCKTIPQAEEVGKYCIHSKNGKDADRFYKEFNERKIDHITAVNILNENANLVNCKYAVFCNINASDIIVPQRIGRSLRHRNPVIIFPYFEGTREQELLEKHLEGYTNVRFIQSIKEI